jgi:hypothetical protein
MIGYLPERSSRIKQTALAVAVGADAWPMIPERSGPSSIQAQEMDLRSAKTSSPRSFSVGARPGYRATPCRPSSKQRSGLKEAPFRGRPRGVILLRIDWSFYI